MMEFTFQYGIIMLVILIAEIVIVAVIFSDPGRVSKLFVDATGKLLTKYYESGHTGQVAQSVWKIIMGVR